jgi:outer membrane lipoprotein carrier protein
MSTRRHLLVRAVSIVLATGAAAATRPASAQAPAASGDGVAALRDFVQRVTSGRAAFSQTVLSPDGQRRRNSSGRLEFTRPGRFRFDYDKPFAQLIVSDGERVWIHDPDLNQASARRASQVLGTTPAAILAGGSLEADFELIPQPPQDGLTWVLARPRQTGGTIQSLRVGFRARVLTTLEILDSFGQRSVLRFTDFETDVAIDPSRFEFVPPPGTDVIVQ